MNKISFINAGAGSGKTFFLTNKLAEDIVSRKYNADEVFITTFSKKAAEEIKLKARALLLERDQTEQAVRLQNAFMGTLHSIGGQLIKKYWYKLDLSPDMKEMGEEEVDFFFNQAISQVPDEEELKLLNDLNKLFHFKEFADEGYSKDNPLQWKRDVLLILQQATANNIHDSSDFIPDYEKFMIHSSDTKGLSDKSESYQYSELFFDRLFPESGGKQLDEKQVRSDIKNVLELLKDDNSNKKRKAKRENLELLWEKDFCYPLIMKALELVDELLGLNNCPERDKLQVFFDKYCNFYFSKKFHEDYKTYLSIVFNIAHKSLEAFQDYKRQHGLIDFNDQERLFLQLLYDEEVQEELRARLKLVMVDEFQDSNPMQLSIFYKLAELAPENVWVGDPKQAIYGFRGSDPELVNEIFEMIATSPPAGSNEAKILKRSWRSRPDLVEFVNRLFAPKFASQLSKMKLKKENVVGYKADEKGTELHKWVVKAFSGHDQTVLSPEETVGLIPVREKEEGLKQNAIHHWHIGDHSKGRPSKMNWIEGIATQLATWIAEGQWVIDKHSRKKRPLKKGDVAILCRKNRTVADVASVLKNHGFEVNAEGDGLDATVEYRIMLNILEYLVNPNSSLAISELMLLFPGEEALTPQQLLCERLEFYKTHGQNGNKDWEELNQWGKAFPFIQQLEAFRGSMGGLSLEALVEKIIVVFDLYGHLGAFSQTGQRRANLQQMVLYARQYKDMCLKMNLAETIAGFVNYLKSSTGKNKQAATQNPNAINVLTYHKAKGLEWPVVICHELDEDYKNRFHPKHLLSTRCESEEVIVFHNSVSDQASFSTGYFPRDRFGMWDESSKAAYPLSGRYVRFAFWPFSDQNSIKHYDELEKNDLFKKADKRVFAEELRLLYVGLTRARDYLIITSHKNRKLSWLNMVLPEPVAPEPASPMPEVSDPNSKLYGPDIPVNYCYIPYEPADEQNERKGGVDFEPEKYFKKTAHTSGEPDHSFQYDPLYRNPSRELAGQGFPEVDVAIVHDLKQSINLTDKQHFEGRYEVLGDLLHDILYLHDQDKIKNLLPGILARYRVKEKLAENELLAVMGAWNNFLTDLKPLNIHRELYMEVKDGNGQVLKGEADCVVEREDDLILIDYKSFPGVQQQVLNPMGEFYAGKYAAQLSAYSQMLEKTFPGKKVSQSLIFYVMQGLVVEVGL